VGLYTPYEVEMVELDASILRREAPVHAGPRRIASLLPDAHFLGQRLGIRDAPVHWVTRITSSISAKQRLAWRWWQNDGEVEEVRRWWCRWPWLRFVQ
jgi:hypothetical protein